MKTLVIGGTGLIGNAIAHHLIDAGHDVRALVRDEGRAREILPDAVELAHGDLTDRASVRDAVDGVDVVFNAGGLPEQWQRDPAIFDRVNRDGAENVFAAALDAGVGRVVHTSTLDVFRKDAAGVLREEQLDPEPKPTPYERSKQQADRIASTYVERGLDLVHTNPASVYGPSPTTTGANQFFVRLLNGEAPMLPPGGMPMGYVEAVAAAHLAAAERGATGERYLLADAYATMRELAELTVEAAGTGKVPRTAPAWLLKTVAGVSAPLARTFGFKPLVAPGELHFLLWEPRVDASKAQRDLGYEPVALRDGVAATVASLKERGIVPT